MTGPPEQPASRGRPRASLLDAGVSRRQFLAAAGAGGALLLLPGLPETASAARRADTPRPAGVGNVAARAVLDFRHRGRANQLGDEPGGIPGVPYSDYTGYTPANAPMDIRFAFDPATVHDPSTWQPLRYV